ncbi:VanZ family protein [Parasphingorhabdus pacifica]
MLSSVTEGVLGQQSVLIVFVVSAVVLGSLGWLMSARRGWFRMPAMLAGISLALAVSVTQGRQPFQFGGLNFSECVLFSASGVAELALNVGMLMPLGLFASLATGRIVAPALFCLAASMVFEAAQGLFATGSCVGQDVASNSIGGACAAVAGGMTAQRWRRQPDHTPEMPVTSR